VCFFHSSPVLGSLKGPAAPLARPLCCNESLGFIDPPAWRCSLEDHASFETPRVLRGAARRTR
jgi:hypothetical protein